MALVSLPRPVITELTREIAGLDRYRPVRVAFRAIEMQDYYPTPLSWRSFKLGASDYEITADEAYCPCGATVRPVDDRDHAVLGDFVDAAEAHIADQHQGARR